MITNPLLLIAAATLVGIAAFAGLLHLIPRLGAAGTRISAWLCRAPGLDLIVSFFTWVPPTVLGILYGWRGVAGAVLRQGLGVLGWGFAPEIGQPQKGHGTRPPTLPQRTPRRVDKHRPLWGGAPAPPR